MKHIRAYGWIIIILFGASPVIPRDGEMRSPVILSRPGMVGTARVVFSPNGRCLALVGTRDTIDFYKWD